MELVTPDIGRPFYRAITTIDALALIEPPPGTSAEGGSNYLKWTRTQRIRTAAGIRLEAVIVDATAAPVYLRIAARAKQLREFGISDKAIGRALGVDDKTVAKAIASLGA
jgi:hypothetical protein